MTARSKSAMKALFSTGDRPTQTDFGDLIDSYQDYGSTVANYYVDSGVTNNVYVITTSPVTTSYTAGMNFAVKIANTNNGASTLDAGGGALSILYLDGSALNPGALPAGGIALFYTDTVNWYLTNLIPASSGGGITALTGDVTASGSGSVTATIANNAVTLAKLATQAANTFLANATSGAAIPTAVALSASQLAGRGSAGDIAAITLDSSLTMTGTTLSVTSGTTAATQAEQETATSTTTYVSPGRQQYHPSALKAWANFTSITATAINRSYGVTSLTDNGAGDTTVNFSVTFSDTNYCPVFGIIQNTGTNNCNVMIKNGTTLATNSMRLIATNGSGTATDSVQFFQVAGDL